MSKIQIVIEIDEEYYEIIKHDVKIRGSDFKPYNLIANGTPFPKGHGRLIDADELQSKLKTWDHNINAIPNYAWWAIKNVPTILIADKEVTDDKS